MGLFVALLFVAAVRLPERARLDADRGRPMVTMGLAWAILRERSTPATVLASLVGALGVVLLVLQGDGAAGRSTSSGSSPPSAPSRRPAPASSSPSGGPSTRGSSSSRRGSSSPAGSCSCRSPSSSRARRRSLPLSGWLALAYLGLIGSGVAYVAWFTGLASMSAGAVAVIGLLNPVAGTLLGVVLLGEPFGPVHLLGMALVLGSVVLAQPQVRGVVAKVRVRRPVRTRHTVEACPSTTSP